MITPIWNTNHRWNQVPRRSKHLLSTGIHLYLSWALQTRTPGYIRGGIRCLGGVSISCLQVYTCTCREPYKHGPRWNQVPRRSKGIHLYLSWALQTRTPGYIRDGIRCLGGVSISCLQVYTCTCREPYKHGPLGISEVESGA
jgi:hypothetical protein